MKIVNVVITGKFSKKINLESIQGCTYKPEKFSGGVCSHNACTFLLFANGSFVCVGAPSKHVAVGDIKGLAKLLDLKVANRTIRNMVMSDKIGWRLNTHNLYEHLRREKTFVTFEDELFSGITWTYKGGTIRLFHTGSFFVTGLRRVKDLISVCRYVRKICKVFRKQN